LPHRLIDPFVTEAQKALAEGIVADADLVDAGAVFGAGSRRSGAVRSTMRSNRRTPASPRRACRRSPASTAAARHPRPKTVAPRQLV
jgi:hypothetical protein